MSDEAPLHYLDIATAAERIRGGKLSPVELTETILDRIAVVDDVVQSYVTVTRQEALNAAKAADKRIRAGDYLGPLDGIPLAIKDLYDTAGTRTTSCSKVRESYVPTEDATSVAKLRAAGAIVLGKVATHEFAFGFDAPPARNPWNTGHTPSGSSGGSGAALAAGLCLGATGSDTGGSIRAPAAANGISGIKPSYGRVSKHGVAVLSWTLDHAGPMARSARDLAILLQAMAGADPLDPTTVDEIVPDYLAALTGNIGDLVIGIPRNFFFDMIESSVETAVRRGIDELGRASAKLVEVDITGFEYLLESFFSIVTAEAATYHFETFRNTPHLYNDDVRQLLEQGNLTLATTYVNAQRSRSMVIDGLRRAFQHVDILVTPGLPVTAPKIGQAAYDWRGEAEPVFRAHARYNCPFNLAGLPAATVPCGFASDGLPVGLQIIGKPYRETTVLRVADMFQRLTNWHKARPPI